MAEEKPKKKVSAFLLILTLILAVVVTGFGKPGFLLDFVRWRAPKTELPAGLDSDDGIAPITGNSAAINVSPLTGITVTAPENTFVGDRTIKMTELSEIEIEAAEQVLNSPDGFPGCILRGWDLDAGLAEGELALKNFNLNFDLSELGILEENYDMLTVFRQGEDGKFYELSVSVQDGVLTALTRENCPVFLVQGLIWTGVVTSVTYVFDSYMATKDEGNTSGLVSETYPVRIDNKVRFRIVLYHNDHLKTLEDRRAALWNAAYGKFENRNNAQKLVIAEKGEAVYKAMSEDAQKALIKQYAAKLADDKLKTDPEYQKVLRDIELAKEKLYQPEIYTETFNAAVTVFKYFESHLGKDEMPPWPIYLYITPTLEESVYATTEGSITIGNPYMKINGNKNMNDPKEKETLLLTMAHEYFHVLQRMRRNRFFSSRKYDEATAMVVEMWVYDDFKAQGKLPTLTKTDVIKEYNAWHLFAMPLDFEGSGLTSGGRIYYGDEAGGIIPKSFISLGEEEVGTDAGYVAGHFLNYIFSREGKKSYKEILDAYNWSWIGGRADFTKLVKKLFGINDSELSTYYRLFIRKNAGKIFTAIKNDNACTGNEEDWKWYCPTACSEAKRPEHARGPQKPQLSYAYVYNHNYIARIRRIAADLPANYNKTFSLLIVKDEKFSSKLPDVELIPVENTKYKQSKYGLFYEAETAANYKNFWMLELDAGTASLLYTTYAEWLPASTVTDLFYDIYGHPNDSSEYRIYTLIAPNEIRPEISGGKIKFKLPEKSTAAQDGYIDGYKVTITPSEGKTYVEHLKIESAGKERSINLTKMIRADQIAFAQFGADTDQQITFTVSVCEYINEADGTRTYGPESNQGGVEALMSAFGATAGRLQITLHWASTDDLDLHCLTPDGSHIYYDNKRAGGGYLEIDKNVHGELSEAIEHIYFDHPQSGEYKFYVDNYKDRTDGDVSADVTVRINNSREGENNPLQQSILMIKEAPMGSRSPTWSFTINSYEDSETGTEFIDGVPGG